MRRWFGQCLEESNKRSFSLLFRRRHRHRDVVDQMSFPLGDQETIADVLAKAEGAAVELVTRYAGPLLSGTAPRMKQIMNWRLMVHPGGRKMEGYVGTNPQMKFITSFARKRDLTRELLPTRPKAKYCESGAPPSSLILTTVFRAWWDRSIWTESWSPAVTAL